MLERVFAFPPPQNVLTRAGSQQTQGAGQSGGGQAAMHHNNNLSHYREATE